MHLIYIASIKTLHCTALRCTRECNEACYLNLTTFHAIRDSVLHSINDLLLRFDRHFFNFMTCPSADRLVSYRVTENAFHMFALSEVFSFFLTHLNCE